MNELKKYGFWLVVGSQDLYGEDVLKQVNENSKVMVESFNNDKGMPCTFVWKPVVRNSDEIYEVMLEASSDKNCAGVITWMHTFSPSKMWIKGLQVLNKPLLHINTQFNKEIPWDKIDMDFMNLNQSAHGDREHGFILARMRINHKSISGYWEDETFRNRVASWTRAAVGAVESRKLKVMRISDNMREVAVTDGDKVEAHIKLGWTINHYGVGDVINELNNVSDIEVDKKVEEYKKYYEIATDNLDSIRYQAKEEVAIKKMMDQGGYSAFHTNFQDLQQLKQLPGLAVQNLMREGYGFAGEGDWKTAALTRVMKLMCNDLNNGTSFIEDYTYDFKLGVNMGAHMLEVCPTLAADKPKIKVVDLGIGDREAPARLTFKAKAGNAILCTIIDMGDRFRMIVNDVNCINQEKEMPNLPVAGVLWKPLPSLETSAEAWMYAGGAHHSVISYDLTADEMRDFAEIMDMEFIHIGAHTDINALRQELAVNDVVWRSKR